MSSYDQTSTKSDSDMVYGNGSTQIMSGGATRGKAGHMTSQMTKKFTIF